MSSYFWGKSPSSAKCESQNSEDRPENEPETNVTSGEIGSCVKDDYVKPDSDLKKEVEGIVDDVRDVGEDKDENGEEKITEKEELSEEEDASDDEDEDEDEEEVENEDEVQDHPRRDYKIDQDKPIPCYHHVGVYAYRKNILREYLSWPESKLEKLEGLEQLRFLSENKKVKCVEVSSRGNVFWELNNPEDVKRIEKVIS